MRLYRVTLRGFRLNGENINYAVAEDSNEAYLKVRKFFDSKNYGLSEDREMDKIELIADEDEYCACKTLLIL